MEFVCITSERDSQQRDNAELDNARRILVCGKALRAPNVDYSRNNYKLKKLAQNINQTVSSE